MNDLIDRERLGSELKKLDHYFEGYTPSEIMLICHNYIYVRSQQIVLDVVESNKKD